MTEEKKPIEETIDYQEELLKYSKKKGQLDLYLGIDTFFFSLEGSDPNTDSILKLSQETSGPVIIKVKELSDSNKQILYKAIQLGQIILTKPKEDQKLNFDSIDVEIERGLPMFKKRISQLVERGQFKDLDKAAKDYFIRNKSQRNFQVDVILKSGLTKSTQIENCPEALLIERQKIVQDLENLRFRPEKK